MSTADRAASAGFGRAVLAMFTGSAAVQLIGLAAAPLTARIYDPDQAGLAGVINGLAAVSSGVVCLRYEQAIALASDRDRAIELAALCLLLAPAVSLLGAAALLVLGGQVLGAADAPSARVLLLAAPLAAMVGGIFAVVTQIALRERRYRDLTGARVVQSSSQVGFQLGLGALFDGRAWVMVWGYIIGFVLGAVALARRQAGLVAELRRALRSGHLRARASEFRRFPIYGSWAAFLDSFAGSLPLFAAVAAYGSAQAGFVRMAQTLVVLPVAALTQAVAGAYWAESARRVRDAPHELLPLYRSVTRRLLLAGGALIAGSFLLPSIVPVLLSPKWTTAGQYAVILAFPAAASLVASGAVNLTLLGQNHVESGWIVGRFLLLFVVAAVASRNVSDVRAFLVLLASAQVVGYAALLWINDHAIKRFVAAAPPRPAAA